MRFSHLDHDRDSAGLRYVYAVLSRRAKGLSIGINLNTNNACNWRCVYCQVPGLVRGKAPPVDLDALERELDGLLGAVRSEGWMERNLPAGSRRLHDVAFSGNGEPTSSPQLAPALERVAAVLARHGLGDAVRRTLITNGSLVHLAGVQEALRGLAGAGGEVWFKLDGATDATLRRVNDCATGIERQRRNLATAARLCPTRVQTLVCDYDGPTLDADERRAYCALLRGLLDEGVPLRGVLLYGLARPSHQPEAPRLAALPAAWLDDFAARIAETTGLSVEVSP